MPTTTRTTTSNSRGVRPRQEAQHTALKTRRLERGLSQNELAALANLSPSWVSILERTPKFMTPRTARALSEVLGIGPEELLP